MDTYAETIYMVGFSWTTFNKSIQQLFSTGEHIYTCHNIVIVVLFILFEPVLTMVFDYRAQL